MTSSIGNGQVTKTIKRPDGAHVLILDNGVQHWGLLRNAQGPDDIYEVVQQGPPRRSMVHLVAVAGQACRVLGTLAGAAPFPDRLSVLASNLGDVSIKKGDPVDFEDSDGVRFEVEAVAVRQTQSGETDIDIRFV